MCSAFPFPYSHATVGIGTCRVKVIPKPSGWGSTDEVACYIRGIQAATNLHVLRRTWYHRGHACWRFFLMEVAAEDDSLGSETPHQRIR
jgi:hypothetical protein